jgi:Fe-S-cluster-containing dehydrogenase component
VTRHGMVVDITKCNGCYNCFLACRDEYVGNDFPPYSLSQPKTGHCWMRLVEKEGGQFPKVKVAYDRPRGRPHRSPSPKTATCRSSCTPPPRGNPRRPR